METKKVAKEYLQKDILRTIYQMRKWKEDDKQIKRILVLDYDLTEYYWKSNIKKLQEEGFLETDSDAKIPALTESGTEYARQLQRAAEGWNQFLQMSGVDEKTADRDGRLMACEVSDPDKIDNLWKPNKYVIFLDKKYIVIQRLMKKESIIWNCLNSESVELVQ